MFFWFLGGSFLAVWLVLRDPSFDYRLLWLGAVVPDAVDAPLGGARVMHSITASVALLVVVMLATIGRRSLRKHLIAFVFGTFLHLVLDGVFNDTKVFWWPVTGWRFSVARLPSLSRGLIDLPLELVGLAILAWVWKRFRFADPDVRRCFVRTGRLGVSRSPNVPACS